LSRKHKPPSLVITGRASQNWGGGKTAVTTLPRRVALPGGAVMLVRQDANTAPYAATAATQSINRTVHAESTTVVHAGPATDTGLASAAGLASATTAKNRPLAKRSSADASSQTSHTTSGWTLLALCIAAIVCLPMLAVIWIAFNPEENIWPHLFQTVLGSYISNTLILMSGVALGTSLIGVSTAWVVTHYEFPFRNIFNWALLPYVIAYVYTDLLEYAGPVQASLRALFGWQLASDYWFPSIRSMPGAILMMVLVLYPYVYLLARAAFLEQSASMLEAARALGVGGRARFLRVALPMARPAIAVGIAMALMETLNDYGTVDYFAVRTLTAGLYDVWLRMNNLGGGAQIATLILLFVMVLIGLEKASRRRQRNYQPTATRFRALSRRKLFRTIALNSIALSATAALCAVVIGVLLSYSQRLRPTRLLQTSIHVSSLGYAVPGAVLAIGVIIPFASFDNAIDSIARSYFGYSTGLLLSGTVFALIFAYTVRFLAVAYGSVDASMKKVSPHMDDAARSLGHSSMTILRRIHLPLMRGGIMTAALVVFVDCMKELPATLVLRPFNFDTLATHVYQFASDELIGPAALGALMIVLVGLAPVILLTMSIDRSRELKAAGIAMTGQHRELPSGMKENHD